MQKKLDYNAAWADAVALFRAYREAVVAVAGFFLFVVSWAYAYIVPGPDMAGAQSVPQMLNIVQAHFVANWKFIVPVTIIGAYGGFVIYVLLSGQELSKVGDSLSIALRRFLPYFAASVITGWLTLIGFAALLIPGLYLVARFVLLPAAMAANPTLGVAGGIGEAWNLTKGIGWKTFFLLLVVAFVTWLIALVVNLITGLLCVLIAGPDGIPLLQTAVEALLSTVQGVIFIALVSAIYRQLKPQAAI